MPKPTSADRLPASAGDAEWAEAVRRERVLRPLAAAARLEQAQLQAAAAELGLSMSRIYDWLRRFRVNPVTSSLLPRRRGPAKGRRMLGAAIEAEIEKAIDAVFLTRERPTLKRVLSEVSRACRTAGLTPPSMKALRARVSGRSLRARTRARAGAATAGDRFRQVRPGLRPERALQIVQIDHTKVDVMLVDDVTRACIGRPWLTLVLDVRTRVVLGLLLSFDPPSASSVALAIAQAVLPKDDWLADRGLTFAWPACGLPETIHVDNGREFHSRAFERGCEQYGIRIKYRPPATPRYGGHIERLMGTLMGRVRFLSNELRLAFVGVGVPEARHALFSDSQLRSRFTDVELPPWSTGEDLRDFLRRLTWSLPLREPSPVDSPKLRRLLVERTGGITLGICKVFERAATAAIRDGRERIDLSSFQDPEVWRGVAMPSATTAAVRRAEAVRKQA